MLCLGSKAAKKQKQGKLSKAEKKRLQKEEEEKRLQEEEEARLQAEREEQERLEKERKRQEVLERLELKDQERREDELTELRHLLEDNHSAVTKWKADSWEKAQWDRYMCCDGTPDPREQREINTYISLWRDNPEVNITPVLEQCDHTLQLIEELEGWLYDVREPAEGDKYQETLLSLQEMISSKLLLATEEILKNACKHSETEMSNMQTVVKDSNITLCLWANLKKSLRCTDIYFEEAGIGFELSKQLAVSSIAVRILHTRYDHLSWLAGIPPLSARSLAGGDGVPPDMDLSEQGETEGEEEVRAGSESSLRHQAAQEEAQSIHGSEGRKSPQSMLSGRSSGNKPVNGQDSQIQTQMEELSVEDSGNTQVELVTDSGVSVQVVDLQQYTPLGGVFYWDVFHLPPQAHSIHDWEIRQILHTRLQEFAYPMKQSKVQGSASSITEDLTCPPVGVSVTLPDFVLFSETPQVARWDAAEKQWRMDGITDFNYEASEAKVSFKMDSFHVFVLMQDTYVNLPFQSWELRPLGQDAALFTVNAALIDLTITIQGNQCMLQSEQDKGLSHLQGKWMGGPALQRAMVNAGINIFVNEYTDKYVSTCGKDPLTEHAAYEQMALLSSACAFSWSQWNAKCGAEHLVMQVCEHHGPSPVPKDSWSLYLLGAQRNQKLEITEKSEAFSPDLYPESEFHSTFIHMLQDDMSTDGTARARNSHYLFVDTVQSLLCATRPLMYS
ncbi:dynein axonemal intermediate chain 7 [Myripristis murdjan]|uniref:dynein axonemal intermediate chain 7 n=1 Tax=Myripristis murdjan TaxID=586833 RepID=UPI0011762F96|nr:protein CASC1 [Myripristis murdjan]